jgi:hypothetical protein
MLRLRDSRTGELTQVKTRHRGELRILVSPGSGAPADGRLGQARAYLIADLIRRFAERAGALPMVCDLVPDGQDLTELRAAASLLNVHPPQHTLPASAPISQFGEFFPDATADFDVCVGTREAALAIAVADVAGDAPGTAEVRAAGDPLAVRLVLLGQPYGSVAEVDTRRIREADETLRGWREQVAVWAKSPSTAMSPKYADAMNDAFGDDLDAGRALRAFAAMTADASEPDGTKFETAASADRLLGLDLAREIGRY